MDEVKFACGSVPVRVAAKVCGHHRWLVADWRGDAEWCQDHGHQSDGLEVWEDQLLHFPEAVV